MKSKMASFLIVWLLFPTCTMAEPAAHPLKAFVKEHAATPELVTKVQTSKAKKVGKILLIASVGAVVGALHARATGGDVAKEALIGAAVAGAGAFAVSKIQDRRLAKRQDVAAREAYEPSQGYRGAVQSLAVSPQVVYGGQTLTITTSYWALGPDPKEKLAVSRFAGIATAGIYVRGFDFAPDPMRFGKGGGEFETTLELQIPQGISPGTYSVVWLLDDGRSISTDSEVSFTVGG